MIETTEQTTITDAVVEARGLTKVFRDFWGRPKAYAVNGIDLVVRPGQVFGLLGPNGSGKSTTVKLLLGLLYPTRGSVRVLGESPRNVWAKRRVGYLPEETYLYRYLSAAETLDFFGALFRIPPAERRRRCDQLLEMVGLARARDRAVGEFSKGMARRIGLAQALINDPDLVILDEPTSGLDPIGCREMKDVIRLLAARGKTVILSSHLLADVEDVCDEIVILYGGRIRARGALRDVLTVKDKTRLTMPRLEPEVLQKVINILREHLSDDGAEIVVDQPTMSLEEFFLDVVRKAREASLETSGVQAGGRIAEYLRGGESAEAPSEAEQRILAALTREENLPAESAARESPPAGEGGLPESAGEKLEAQAEAEVEERLEALVQEQETEEKPAAETAPERTGSQPPQEAVDRKLRQLLEQDGDAADESGEPPQRSGRT